VTEVNINTASLHDLEGLPGVGSSTAQKILDYRNQHGTFHSAEELLAVKGIGPKKLEKMKPFVRV
jgi:competence protein ComEA